MASLLIVTSNERAERQIQQVASLAGISFTIAQSYSTAKEYLSMENFDAVLVDTRLEGGIPTELLILSWKYNPMLMGALFNLSGTIPDPWEARLYGSRIFQGDNALDEIQKALQMLPDILLTGTQIKHKILFVENLDSPRAIISAYIEMLGYPYIESVSRAAEGLEKLKDTPDEFFCIITDIRMPNMSGIEMTRVIRADKTLKHLPIIYLTAVPSRKNFIEGLKAGGTGFLVKPPQKRLLRAELEKAQRLFVSKQSPVLCKDEDAHMIDELLTAQYGGADQ